MGDCGGEVDGVEQDFVDGVDVVGKGDDGGGTAVAG